MPYNNLKHIINFSRCSLAALCVMLFVLPACTEDSYGPPRTVQAVAEAENATQPEASVVKPSEPVLIVGDVTMPMPVPTGFRRVPVDHPLMRASQAGLDNDEILLCLFERIGDGAAASSPALDLEALLQRETLQVSTLSKWLNVELSSLDFLKIKEPWQDESVQFNQNTLIHFEEAARGRLEAEREFSYNLGMIDSSPLHISFLKVMKHTAPAGEVIYTCKSTSLVWRYGKILRISYNKHIENFGQIQGVVAESVGYLQKLQTIDRSTRLSSAPS